MEQTTVSTGLQSFNLNSWQEEYSAAQILIDMRMEERVTQSVHHVQVVKTALARYFRLLDRARLDLSGVLSSDEIMMMLHAAPREILLGEYEHSPADFFFSAFGEDLVEEGSPQHQLCTKLAGLSALQQIALIDILECAWRDRTVGPFAYAVTLLNSSPTDKLIM